LITFEKAAFPMASIRRWADSPPLGTSAGLPRRNRGTETSGRRSMEQESHRLAALRAAGRRGVFWHDSHAESGV